MPKGKKTVSEDEFRPKIPMEHLNIAEFNRGQSSKRIRKLVEEDKVAYIHKRGKPQVVVISYERYERLLEKGVDVNDAKYQRQ